MKIQVLGASFLAVLAASPAAAQEISGASITATYKDFDSSDTATTNLTGGVDVFLAPSFGLGGNLSYYTINDDDIDPSINATLHGMYMASPDSGYGVFIAQETRDDDAATLYGVQAGFGSDIGNIEGYYGAAEIDDFTGGDLSVFGVNLMFDVANNIAVGLSYESVTEEDAASVGGDIGDLTLRDTALLAQYHLDNGAAFFAEIGTIRESTQIDGETFVGSDEAEYIAIGASYRFGRKSGTLFSDRNILSFGE